MRSVLGKDGVGGSILLRGTNLFNGLHDLRTAGDAQKWADLGMNGQ